MKVAKLLASPFILALLLIAHNFFAIKRWIQFIRHGGEIILYKEDDVKTIQEIYQELKKTKE